MEIGLEKLIEMIEQRLGKTAANALLGLIVLAVVGVACHLIWDYLAVPLFHGASTAIMWMSAQQGPKINNLPPVSIPWPNAARWLVELIVIGGILFVVGKFTRELLEENRIYRDIKSNPQSIWTKSQSDKVLERARMNRDI